MHLMLTANHAPNKWRGQTIGIGQKLTSRAKLSAETKLSEQQIRTCLERLKSTNEITIQATKRQTVITLCNYETYQSAKQDVNQPINQQNVTIATNNQPTINQATNKKVKNDKKSKARAHTLDEVIEFCKSIELPESDGEATWDKWEGNGHKNSGRAMKCWKSTIRSWKANGYMPSQKQNGNQQQTISFAQKDEERKQQSNDQTTASAYSNAGPPQQRRHG